MHKSGKAYLNEPFGCCPRIRKSDGRPFAKTHHSERAFCNDYPTVDGTVF
jgi:hypothetical protein